MSDSERSPRRDIFQISEIKKARQGRIQKDLVAFMESKGPGWINKSMIEGYFLDQSPPEKEKGIPYTLAEVESALIQLREDDKIFSTTDSRAFTLNPNEPDED